MNLNAEFRRGREAFVTSSMLIPGPPQGDPRGNTKTHDTNFFSPFFCYSKVENIDFLKSINSCFRFLEMFWVPIGPI